MEKEIWTIDDIIKDYEDKGLAGRSKVDFLNNVKDFILKNTRYVQLAPISVEKHEKFIKELKQKIEEKMKNKEFVSVDYTNPGLTINSIYIPKRYLNLEEYSLDINRSLYNIENRKIYEYDDDIATLFYKGYKVAKGRTETFRYNWCEEVSYCKDMNDFLDDIGIELAIELDDEDVKDNWEHIWDELEWNEESKSYKYKNWEWIVLDI